MTEPTAPRERVVLAWLRMSGKQGACVTDMPQSVAYSARNAVSRLRAMGIGIKGERCKVHRHAGSVARYWLEDRT
jgi:hypothetical protein